MYKGATIIDNLSFENDTDNYDIYVYDPIYSYTTLKNKNMINKFGVRFGSQDTPEITLDDNFSTTSQINFECIATGEAYSAFYIQDENLGSEENPLIIEGYDNTATLSADYDDSESNVRVFATKNSCHITMKNLTITGGTTTGSGSALYYYGGVLTLEDCVIEGNSSSSTNSDSGLEYDVYMYSSSKLNLTETECYDGIYLSSSSAYFGDDCVLGYDGTENTPIMHIDSSTVTLSGSVSLFNSIYSDAKNPIYIDSTLTAHTSASTGSKVSVVLSNYETGTQIVSLVESSTANIEEETAKFYLQDENYAIDTSGQIISQN